MTIIATYYIDKDLYYAPDTKHDVSLSTTEYIYKSDTLVHLLIGRNLGIRLNNSLRYEFKKEAALQNEQFMSKKSYSHGKVKSITRSTFEEKLKRFDMSQTVVEQEIVEEYTYADKSGCSDEVQIVITVKEGKMTAAIDFKDAGQYENVICPAWLIKPT